MPAANRIECARVFLSLSKKRGKTNYDFTLNCFVCHSHFKHWTSFVLHVQQRHEKHLERAQAEAKKSKEYDDEEDEGRAEYQDLLGDVLKEETIEAPAASSRQKESIDISDFSTVDRKWSFEEKNFPPIVDFQVEIMPLDYKPDDDIKSEYSEEFCSIKYERTEAKSDQHSEDSQNEEKHSYLDATNASENVNDTSENMTTPRAQTRKRKRTPKAQAMKELQQEEEEGDESDELNDKLYMGTNSSGSETDEDNLKKSKQKREPHSLTKGPFFHMHRTSPQTIHNFIDIIREHPCYWDPEHLDFSCKDAREVSAMQISEQLAQRHNIVVTPRVAHGSVLFLCRWYEREHISMTTGDAKAKTRSKKSAAKRPRPNTHYPDYYTALQEFLPSHHLKVFKCDQCPREFKCESLMLTHKHAVHDADAPFKCGHCPRRFAHASTLRYHENRHTKVRTWQCELCPHRSVSVADHETHMTTHSSMRAFVCETCGAAYKSSTSLSVHKRTHAPPRLACPRCGKMFRENYRLKRHMWVHEADNDEYEVDEASLSHRCDMCKRRFASVATLQQHRKLVHSININTTTTTTSTKPTMPKVTTKPTSTMTTTTTTTTVTRVKSKPVRNRARTPSPAAEEQDTDYSCTACEVDFINLKELRTHSRKMHDTVMI